MLGESKLRTGTHMLALRQRVDSRARWVEVVQAMEETAQRAWLKREGLARVTRAVRRVREARATAEREAAEGPRQERKRKTQRREKAA